MWLLQDSGRQEQEATLLAAIKDLRARLLAAGSSLRIGLSAGPLCVLLQAQILMQLTEQQGMCRRGKAHARGSPTRASAGRASVAATGSS